MKNLLQYFLLTKHSPLNLIESIFIHLRICLIFMRYQPLLIEELRLSHSHKRVSTIKKKMSSIHTRTKNYEND